jgi:carboxylesterase type B
VSRPLRVWCLIDDLERVNVWHSIPYALPPTGKLRWHAPSAIDKINITSSAVLDASKLGPACIQGCPVWETKCVAEVQKLRQSEDCLRLDVLSPISAPKPGPNSTLLPVIVKIHGGGYVKGNSEYAGGYSLIKHSQGALVYVSIQYRLGVYGFLASRELERDGVANTGLLDQRLALIWVKRYAEKFGGDPERITIVGGSAGGGSVTAQMMLYGAVDPPPFKAAIAGKGVDVCIVENTTDRIVRVSMVAIVQGSKDFSSPVRAFAASI